MNTKLSQRAISGELALEIVRQVAEVILLMGIGAIGVLIHAKFRMPLGIPGRYGLIYMAILISGKLVSKKSYAASLSSMGAVLMLLAPLGFNDPFMPLYYALPGFITDECFRISESWRNKLLLLGLIGGLAYMTLPLSRIIIYLISGFPFGAFTKWGFLGVTAMHFLFGFAGGLAGTSLVRVFRTRRKK
jgi:hypothetical protein